MTMTSMPPARRRAFLDDIDRTLDLLALKLRLAHGVRARARILAEIDECKRQRERLLCG